MKDTVEITSILKLKGSGDFKTFLSGVDIIPDPTVKNGHKRTRGNRVFISESNYDDIKGASIDGIILVIDNILQEETP